MVLLQSIFAKNVALLIQFILAQGYFVSLGEAWRSPEQCEWNAAHGKGIVHSLHINRMAIDLNLHDHKGIYLQDEQVYATMGKYWESLDDRNRWGGYFNPVAGHGVKADLTHFEMHEKPIPDIVRKLR